MSLSEAGAAPLLFQFVSTFGVKTISQTSLQVQVCR